MRIAAHNGAREFGGGEKWTLLLLRGLARRGHEVRFFCRDEGMAARAADYGVPAEVGRLGGHLMLPDALRLAGRLRDWKPDAFLVSTYKKIWLAGMAARLARVPTVVARIGLSTDLPDRHWTYRLALRRWTDAVLLNADGIRTDFVAGLPGFDPARIVTVYDGIDLSASSGGSSGASPGRSGYPEAAPGGRPAGGAPDGAGTAGAAGSAGSSGPAEADGGAGTARAAARRRLGLPLDAQVVGTVTRLGAQKRIDRMLDAVALLPVGVHLAVAGTGELEDHLRAHADRAGVADRVHFLGFQDDVAGVLAALDVFLLSSDKEGMANAMLEAMAAGVPVVSTQVSGAREALDARRARAPGESGVPVAPARADAPAGVPPTSVGDAPGAPPAGLVVDATPAALAEAVQALLDDPERRRRLGAEGARRARTVFSYEGMVDAWEHVLAGGAPGDVHQGASPLRP